MRVRTDARRRAIVAAAWDVFREAGFERTTMAEISDRLGGSKSTLYGYFQSKEQLFAAALEQVLGQRPDEAVNLLAADGPLESRLLHFAAAFLQVRLAPDAIAVERALIGVGERSDLGERLRLRFIEPYFRRIASVLDNEMQKGRLRKGDPMIATWQLRGMIEADLHERRLHGDTTITAHEVNIAASEGVEAFLRAYSP